jgi:hypothetical protein
MVSLVHVDIADIADAAAAGRADAAAAGRGTAPLLPRHRAAAAQQLDGIIL